MMTGNMTIFPIEGAESQKIENIHEPLIVFFCFEKSVMGCVVTYINSKKNPPNTEKGIRQKDVPWLNGKNKRYGKNQSIDEEQK